MKQNIGNDPLHAFLFRLRRTLDSLSANKSLAAAEQHKWSELREAGDPLAQGLVTLYVWCLHHQACLGKKPALLRIPGLCSGLVRMCHSFRSAKFRTDFLELLEKFAHQFKQVTVLAFPQGANDWLERNKLLLQMCSEDLTDDQVTFLLAFFNFDFLGEEAGHYCLPGCCLHPQDFRLKRQKAFTILLGAFPDVLWKHHRHFEY